MELAEIKKRYVQLVEQSNTVNMERGWPCREQLDLSMPMLDMVTSSSDLVREVDYRGYAGTAGIEPLKELFADVLEVKPEEIYIGGTMSTSIMYDIVNKAVLFGLDGFKPWKDLEEVKFICPAPGYEKHFNICKTFNIKMIPVEMKDDGPDMDEVEKLVSNDESIKGIWCVPLYSNPTGTIYSDETVRRIANLNAKAPDFRVFWDNAYVVHHLTGTRYSILNIIRECEKAGVPNRVWEFTSTSKITFPGGGVGVCASSVENIKWLTKNSLLQLKSGDKINQLRHYLFLKTKENLLAHMDKHRAIIAPKFDIVDEILTEELGGNKDICKWDKPKGGYFFNLELKSGIAKRTWELCKNAGVAITPAGSTFPYGLDPRDSFLRLAPTYPSTEDLKIAIRTLAVSMLCAYYDIDV